MDNIAIAKTKYTTKLYMCIFYGKYWSCKQYPQRTVYFDSQEIISSHNGNLLEEHQYLFKSLSSKVNKNNQLMHNINTNAFTALVLKPHDYNIIVTPSSFELYLDEN